MSAITIINGDCLDIIRELDQEVDAVVTDPPYFLSRDGGTTCKSGKRASVAKGSWDRPESIFQMRKFNWNWIKNCLNVLRVGGSFWVSGTFHNIYSCGSTLQTLGAKILNHIVWEKSAPPPNLGCRCFTHSHESIIWATKGKGHIFRYQDMKAANGGKQMKDIWIFSRPSKHEKRYGKHPTQKPEALIERIVSASTNPGDLILDPFLGSGTTAVVAKRLGRRCIGIEQDSEWCAIAQKRVDDEQ